MYKHTALILGIQLTPEDGELLLDRFYELEERNEGVLDIKWGECSDYLYLGQLLAKSEPHSDDRNCKISINIPSIDFICYRLKVEYNIEKSESEIDLWFFDYWR